MSEEKKVKLNNKKLTEQEFLEKKKEAEKKNLKIVEVKPNEYRTKLEE